MNLVCQCCGEEFSAATAVEDPAMAFPQDDGSVVTIPAIFKCPECHEWNVE